MLFTFEKVTKLDLNKTILVGTVTFNLTQISGDGIIIDFVKKRVLYHEKGNRYAYKLEIDNRTAQLWNGLLAQLKQSLENRNEQPGLAVLLLGIWVSCNIVLGSCANRYIIAQIY